MCVAGSSFIVSKLLLESFWLCCNVAAAVDGANGPLFQLSTRLLPVALSFSGLTGNDVVGRDEIARELVTLTFVSFAAWLNSRKSTTISAQRVGVESFKILCFKSALGVLGIVPGKKARTVWMEKKVESSKQFLYSTSAVVGATIPQKGELSDLIMFYSTAQSSN